MVRVTYTFLFEEIIDRQIDGSYTNQKDAFIVTQNSNIHWWETIKGWGIILQREDRILAWISLNNTNNFYPVQLYEYELQIYIVGEPEFSWWIQHVMINFNWIIGKIKYKYWVHNHNFLVKIPKSVAEANTFNEDNGNTLWWDITCKEMKNPRP